MRKDRRRRAEAKARRQSNMRPIAVGVLLLILVIALYQWGTPAPEIDARLCPKDTGPVRTTVLLLDTSDPLTPKHEEELKRLLGQVTSGHRTIGLSPGDLLVVYKLTQDPGAPKSLFGLPQKPGAPKPPPGLCLPSKNPKDFTARDDVHRGRRVAEQYWNRFEEALTNAFPRRVNEQQTDSPLLETIAVLAARHIPGKRANKQHKVHLIVFSDLLQNTPRLSHYRNYPQARAIAPDILTDLTGSEVSLFRLERHKHEKLQTEAHFSWWLELIREQGGKIVWHEKI